MIGGNRIYIVIIELPIVRKLAEAILVELGNDSESDISSVGHSSARQRHKYGNNNTDG